MTKNISVIGRGRMGSALASALGAGEPLGRGSDGAGADIVLLCVPDGEIAAAAALVAPGRLVGHCSGATTLDVLAPHEAFSLHPLMTVPQESAQGMFLHAGCAVAGSTPRALETAFALAEQLGMNAVEIDDEDRAAYHAAASMASNFLVTLEAAAERVLATAGADRDILVPLVRAAVENWAELGPERALTGPIARGDEATVERQRAAVEERAPDLLALFDALADATRELAETGTSAGHPAPRSDGDGPASGRPRPMITVRSVEALRAALKPLRRQGRTIGLVPTMGYLHEGHLSLIRAAAAECDEVVVSLFVNPAQFNDPRDLEAYPRDEQRDAELAAAAGAGYLFAPPVEAVYPPGFSTTVAIRGVTEPLEGAHRGVGHFDGVTTVVTKLFNMVGPDVAYFGQKDAQQALVIRKLVRDLDMPLRIEVLPTVREPDGLALSSRNVRLNGSREQALALSRALRAAERAVASGQRDAAAVRAAALAEMTSQDVEPEYLELVDTKTLAPVDTIDGEVLLAVAAQVDGVRLIDNTLLSSLPPGGKN